MKYFSRISLSFFALSVFVLMFFYTHQSVQAQSQEGVKKISRVEKFLGDGAGDIFSRIGSLTIGQGDVSSWLSGNSSSTSRDQCVNKLNTANTRGRGTETCLDIVGGGIFDAIFVSQPAYILGQLVLNSSFLGNEISGIVIGNDAGVRNSILATGLGGSSSANLCANEIGEVYRCDTWSNPEVTYDWEISSCQIICRSSNGLSVDTGSCTGEAPVLPDSCIEEEEELPEPIAEYRFDECYYDPAFPDKKIVPDSLLGNDGYVPWGLGTVDAIGRAINFRGSTHHDKKPRKEGGFPDNNASEYGVMLPQSQQESNNFSYAGWLRADDKHQIDQIYDIQLHSEPSGDDWAIGHAGLYGQRWAINPEQIGSDKSSAGTGISYGSNGVSLYEKSAGIFPARIVYESNLGTGWNHVAVTYTNNKPRLYVNGVFVGEGSMGAAVSGQQKYTEAGLDKSIVSPKQLGHSENGIFNGQIDEFKVYDKPLTSGQIALLYETESTTTRDNSCEATEYYWAQTGWWCNGYTDQLQKTAECRFRVGDREYLTDDSLCASAPNKPSVQYGQTPCVLPTYEWFTYAWEGCVDGQDKRWVVCNDSNGNINVGDEQCSGAGSKPPSYRSCNTNYQWHIYAWEGCVDGQDKREVHCDNLDTGAHNVGDDKCAAISVKPSPWKSCAVSNPDPNPEPTPVYNWSNINEVAWSSCSSAVGKCLGEWETSVVTSQSCVGTYGGESTGENSCLGSWETTKSASCSGQYYYNDDIGDNCSGQCGQYTWEDCYGEDEYSCLNPTFGGPGDISQNNCVWTAEEVQTYSCEAPTSEIDCIQLNSACSWEGKIYSIPQQCNDSFTDASSCGNQEGCVWKEEYGSVKNYCEAANSSLACSELNDVCSWVISSSGFKTRSATCRDQYGNAVLESNCQGPKPTQTISC